jgi:hypothetical protein
MLLCFWWFADIQSSSSYCAKDPMCRVQEPVIFWVYVCSWAGVVPSLGILSNSWCCPVSCVSNGWCFLFLVGSPVPEVAKFLVSLGVGVVFLSWTPVRECARTLWMGVPFWEKGGPVPKGGNKERQLSPDKERDKTWYVVRWEDS